ncbi:MAG: adenylate kinase [Actinobacteria bacterium]|nr:adenylate kinase [Actinomycetota bacterium]
MRLIFLGAPGVGKGTQAKKIASKFNIPHVSTGDILRAEIKKGSILGKKAAEFVHGGKLVPDEIILEMIKEQFKTDRFKSGFLMDGFPRTLEQAEKFSKLLKELDIKIDRVINIVVDEEEIVKRLTNRLVCGECKKIFSLSEVNKNGSFLCDVCGSELSKRKDDSEEVIKHRIEVYKSQTQPLVEFYSKKKLLENIDGHGTEDEIFERILARL